MHEKIKRIADLYGWFHQSLKLIEEMAELIVATIKLMLHIRTEQMWKNYIEELADVQIMLHQLIYLSNKKKRSRRSYGRKGTASDPSDRRSRNTERRKIHL